MNLLTRRQLSAAIGSLAVSFVVAVDAHAVVTLNTLKSFSGTDGHTPYARLTFDPGGNLYGSTYGGGPTFNGTLFKITSGGTFSTLHNFTGATGSLPRGGMVYSNGVLYGTTIQGGANNKGTVFSITPTGTLNTLVTFATANNGSQIANGSGPTGDLIADASGVIYGTTAGGTGVNQPGSVFKYTPVTPTTGAYQLVGSLRYNASSSNQNGTGYNPNGGLYRDPATGYLYGTAAYEGSSNGTVFRVVSGTPTTATFFTGGTTGGSTPYATMVPGPDGNLYGTTALGGASGKGVIFKYNLSTGAITTLVSMTTATGSSLNGNLLFDAAGNIFGTAPGGGANSKGTVFKYSRSGVLSTVFSFSGTNGSAPYGGLVADASGALYGTTSTGGATNQGTVFKLTGAGYIATLKPGDTNYDDAVNFTDLLTLAQNYGGGPGKNRDQGEFTGDGYVNFADLLLLAQNYGSPPAQAPAVIAADWALAQSLVPEPTATFAAVLAVVSTLGRRRLASYPA